MSKIKVKLFVIGIKKQENKFPTIPHALNIEYPIPKFLP